MSEDDVRYEPARIPDARPGPEGGKRHRNRMAKTKALVEAALVHFLERGLETVTIDDIVTRAGVSKGSFYRYFENKDALVTALFQPLTEEVGAAMARAREGLAAARDAASLEAAYATLAGDLLQTLTAHGETVQLFVQERAGPRTEARAPVHALDDEIVDTAVALSRVGRSNGLLKPFDPHVSAIAVIGGIYELLRRFFEGTLSADPLTGASQLVELVLHGVRAQEPRGAGDPEAR